MRIYSKNRKSNRLTGHDCSQPGKYFVTMCTKDQEPLFGAIENGKMRVNGAGRIAVKCWEEMPKHFRVIQLDEFVVMPDHLHGIVVIVSRNWRTNASMLGGAIQESPRPEQDNCAMRRRMLLPMMIGRFKQNSAKQINIVRGTPGIPVWQRGYFDHIIRDNESLARIRDHIIKNPRCWEMHRENIAREQEETAAMIAAQRR
jgi:REP element-mobilizing transposase RayT